MSVFSFESGKRSGRAMVILYIRSGPLFPKLKHWSDRKNDENIDVCERKIIPFYDIKKLKKTKTNKNVFFLFINNTCSLLRIAYVSVLTPL